MLDKVVAPGFVDICIPSTVFYIFTISPSDGLRLLTKKGSWSGKCGGICLLSQPSGLREAGSSP